MVFQCHEVNWTRVYSWNNNNMQYAQQTILCIQFLHKCWPCSYQWNSVVIWHNSPEIQWRPAGSHHHCIVRAHCGSRTSVRGSPSIALWLLIIWFQETLWEICHNCIVTLYQNCKTIHVGIVTTALSCKAVATSLVSPVLTVSQYLWCTTQCYMLRSQQLRQRIS